MAPRDLVQGPPTMRDRVRRTHIPPLTRVRHPCCFLQEDRQQESHFFSPSGIDLINLKLLS
jgi:hypothetical protein